MSIKKILLLFTMALAMAAFASPHAALAAEPIISDEGEFVEEDSIELTGDVEFSSLGTGIKCTVHATLKILGIENYISKFDITTKTCVFYGILFGRCKFEEKQADTVTKLLWYVDITGEDTLTITGHASEGPGIIDTKLENRKPGEICFTTKSDITVKDITMDVETVGGFIDAFKLTGEVKADDDVGEMGLVVSGTFGIGEEDTETFQIID